MLFFSSKPPQPQPSKSSLMQSQLFHPPSFAASQFNLTIPLNNNNKARPLLMCCSDPNSSVSPARTVVAPPVSKKRKRYRKPYPGESKGITEEMRFVAMRLRNVGAKYTHKNITSDDDSQDSANDVVSQENEEEEGGLENETWVPSVKGFVKYLVDSKLVFDTVERIVDKSDDVSYAYFRNTGLERSVGLANDLDWVSQQMDIVIPEASVLGVSYAKYLEELAEKSAPLFLTHFYNVYFSHIVGGQIIARKVSEIILEGRELEFYRWKGDVQELLKAVREKLNMLGEHWSRDERNRCLKEGKKSFKYLGQIVRLIIL